MNPEFKTCGPCTLPEIMMLAALCLCAFVLFSVNNDFPLYFHADELKKVNFVIFGNQDFKHPILLLQLAKFANLFFQEVEPESLAIVGRSISATAGVAILIAGYFLSRHLLADAYRWLGAALIAVSPIVVVHAHYFKEDMVFTAACLFSLLFYIHFIEQRQRKHFIGLVIATGLALSAQYKSILLVPLYFLFPLLDSRIERKGLSRDLAKMFGFGLIITLVINYQAITNVDQLLRGIFWEVRHVSTGHTLRIYPLPNYFSYHLIKSLVPGLTIPVLVLGIAGLGTAIVRWKQVSTGWRLLAVYSVLFYLVHEITPMKPAPGFMRYMIPISPALLIFAAYSCRMIVSGISRYGSGIPRVAVMTFVIAVVAGPSLYKSIMLVKNLNENDTRLTAYRWLAERKDEGNVYFGKHTLLANKKSGRIYVLKKRRMKGLRDNGFKYAIASSFGYDPYFEGRLLEKQTSKVEVASTRFRDIFKNYPYHEIRPDYMSFAFSNPTIRIIDISKDPSQQ